MRGVILAGGLGTRLRPYTLFLPKPMLPLGDRPIIEHLIEWLKKNGITDLTICVGYLRKIIEEYFEDGKELGVSITYARANRPLGTAGQLRSAESLIKDRFVCLYGDSIIDFNLKDAIRFHEKKKALATMILMEYKTNLKYGFIDLDGEGRVKEWNEKPEYRGLINVGCYIMEKKFLKYIPEGKMYGMDVAFRNAIDAGERIYGYPTKGVFIDIGDRKSYASAYEKYLSELGKIL
ncbi:MAG: nucleotidyltransferase family protein [Thaumarchaeota archaeon]|nr:nucleotidyltransferase family protein [Nitrososphaerota archaeon]